ncbi:MAG: hypothetical protein JXB05_38385 [Myxococcaceae bacterium]|nr:hypothetical protein [Myxococcaceae bacterium]
MKTSWKWVAVLLVLGAVSCGDDADDERIGAECTSSGQCENEELTCLAQFKGGYCGASGCMANADCPQGSICVTQAGANYCFRACDDKAECNRHRTVENESNCSSNITRVEAGTQKACVPPSGT